MKGSAFVKTLPKTAGQRREQMIFDAVRRRDMPPIAWEQVRISCTNSSGDTYEVFIKVSKDALRVGDASDSFRFSVNHRTAQHIADDLDVVLPTPKLSDEIWGQAAIRLQSLSQAHKSWVDDGTMGNTARMYQQSKQIDAAIAKEQKRTNKNGLIADVGKDWVTSARLFKPYTPSPRCEKGHPRANNYGWHLAQKWQFTAATPKGKYVLQPSGLCHTIPHVDYSQVVRVVRRDVYICGPGFGDTGCGKIDIRALATDPALACLVNHDGALPSMRHPDVPPTCEEGKRCPNDAGDKKTNGVNGNSNGSNGHSHPGGPISCPIDCEKLPPAEVDPTYGAGPIVEVAAMSGTEKAVLFAAGATVGYFALRWLLPSPSSRAGR